MARGSGAEKIEALGRVAKPFLYLRRKPPSAASASCGMSWRGCNYRSGSDDSSGREWRFHEALGPPSRKSVQRVCRTRTLNVSTGP